jgi:FkbM family methyltransferase
MVRWMLLFVVFACTAECQARFEGFFEEYNGRRLDLVAKFLPENPTIFEAGGHYGEDTARLSQKWPKGRVISFEPNPPAFTKLLEATRNLDNIAAYHLAVSTYNGKAILNVCYGTNGNEPIFEGASSLLVPTEAMKIHYQGPKVEVPCVVLDDWCQAHQIDHFDFLWLDLEGLELQVLRSSPRILDQAKVIYTETNFYPFRKGTTQFAELRKFLENAGFMMLSHWYTEGLQGDAIFVKKECLDF